MGTIFIPNAPPADSEDVPTTRTGNQGNTNNIFVRRTASMTDIQNQHLGSHRQYWRDIILGVNDGLVSTFLLVAGVAGGGLSSKDILLTSIAGALAGAVSMCAGEYVATKSQNEVMEGELKLEKYHIQVDRAEEIKEVLTLLKLIGVTEQQETLRDQLMLHYESNPDALLQLMKTLEFGIVEEEVRSPIKAGLVSCILFVSGSLPSIIPFIFSGSQPILGLIIAAVFTIAALILVGAVKTWATRGNCCVSATENLVIAGVGGAFAYGVGYFFESVLG